MITEKRYASCRNASQSGYFPGGKYRYRKKFELTADEEEKKVSLLFEGVYRNCEVYVNGSLAGAHKYGYGEFTVDIGAFVRGNTATENLPLTSARLSAGASTLWKWRWTTRSCPIAGGIRAAAYIAP